MAYRCQARKDKIKELDEKKKEKVKDQIKKETQTGMEAVYKNLPNNYIAVITSAITLANIKEKNKCASC